MELANSAELGGGEVAKVAGAKAAEDVDDVGFKVDGGLGVDEVEGGGGAPTADPVEGALEGGGPWGDEYGEGVLLGGEGLDVVVLGVVGHDFVDDMEEVVLVLGGGGVFGTGGELLHQAVELLEPRVVEASEAVHGRRWGQLTAANDGFGIWV